MEVQGPQLLPRLSDQVALADQDLISVPAETLPLGAVAPAHHGAPAGKGANRKIIKPEDLLDDRTPR